MHRSKSLTLIALILLTFAALTSPARAISPMIQGWAWVDTNCDGIRQDSEPPATSAFLPSDPYLYRFGADGKPFTADDKQLRIIGIGSNGIYTDDTDSAIMPNELYRLSILQGGRPAGYLPTLYRQGSDPARWSSLQRNWTTGDPDNGGFALDLNSTVSGGNIGIAPPSCVALWYPHHVALPLLVH